MKGLLKRYRTSRGFGVHSPLAYELITGPLRDRGVAYYCFDRVVTPRGRRLVRLAARLGADSVAILGETDPDTADIVDAARQFDLGGDRRMVIAGNGADPEAVREAAKDALLTAVYDMSLWPALCTGEAGTAAFTDGREGFIVRRRDLRGAIYEISFR